VDTESPDVSPEYVAATQPILDFLNNPTIIKEHVIGNIWDDCSVTDMYFSTVTYDDNRNVFNYYTEYFMSLSEYEKMKKFEKVYQALLKDIDEGKVFQTTFAGYSSEREDQSLYNDFGFNVVNKEVPYFSDVDTYYDEQYDPRTTYEGDGDMHEQSIYCSLNTECKHTLKALKDAEFYYSNDQVITWEKYNKIMGYEYEEDPETYE